MAKEASSDNTETNVVNTPVASPNSEDVNNPSEGVNNPQDTNEQSAQESEKATAKINTGDQKLNFKTIMSVPPTKEERGGQTRREYKKAQETEIAQEPTPTQTKETLEEIAQGFEAAQSISELKYFKYEKSKEHPGYLVHDIDKEKAKLLTKKYERGIKLFSEHFLNLWD